MSKKERLQIAGPVGRLELRVFRSDKTPKLGNKKSLAVISHPHSLYGGTMDNKVVTTLERFYQSIGFSTIVYNFRGVGQSEGAYDNGQGEQLDLKAVVDWAKNEGLFDRLLLAGFSFGAFVTLSAQANLKADRLMIVAPPVGLYDFSSIEEVDVPWHVVIGLEDEVVDADEMVDWVMQRQLKPTLHCRSQASHFLHGQLIWLKKILSTEY